jgi:HAD superfamily hydrolase (TIGR01549 family)
MTTAVWFDLDETVVQYELSRRAIFEEALPNPPAGALDAFLLGFFRAVDVFNADPYVRGFELVAREDDIDLDAATRAERYVDAEIEASTIPEATVRTVEKVGELGPVGILTNGSLEVTRRKLADHGVLDIFDDVVVSGDVGAKKPDPSIFNLAKDRLPADRAVYVGDSYEMDIVPAAESGFDTVHVRNDGGPTVSVDRTASIDVFTTIVSDEI